MAGAARNVGRAWLEVDGPEPSAETVGEMAIIQVLLAALARSAGRILNTAVGWATTMIFGRVPEKRQI